MLVGVFPAHRDSNGEWRFAIMTHHDNAARGQMIFGTEEGEEEGMLEPKFRTFLADQFKLSAIDIDRAVSLATGEKVSPG
jgi:hypothetical protein